MTDVMTDKFISDTLTLAAGYAAWFSGVPDTEVMPRLDEARANMAAELSEKFGADVATQIAQAFVEAVIKCKRELEAGRGATLN